MLFTYFISKKHTHKLPYLHSLYTVNYILTGQCFIYKVAPTRGTPLKGEFFPNSGPFPLIVFFVFLLSETAPMVPAQLGKLPMNGGGV